MNITYVSACMDASGYAEAARNHIAALNSVGVTVNVKPITFEGYRSDLGKLGAVVQSLVGRNPDGNIQILHATPQNYPKLQVQGKYNIGYCAWETDRLPPDWVGKIDALQEVWVPSTHNKQVLSDSGISIPIFVMPHPFDTDKGRLNSADSVVANLGSKDFVFYSIFQWIERKNPTDLLKAYLTEFTVSDDVTLIIKTYLSNPDHSQEAQKIKEMIGEVKKKLHMKSFPKILLVSSLLSKKQIRALHNQGDCYVSLHRCEGFGIPFAEAMLEENPVIATGYGGPQDFMSTQELVDYKLTPVYGMPWSIYTGDMKWAQPDIMHARKLMREMYEDRARVKELGEAGRNEIVENLSWEKMGNLMKDRLEEIEKELK